MKIISCRGFLQQSFAGGTLITAKMRNLFGPSLSSIEIEKLKQVVLGKTGIKVFPIALGTGTKGWKFKSNQTVLGDKGFIDLPTYAYNSGIQFCDVADIYGSHRNINQVLKEIPRERVVILSKIWTQSNDWIRVQSIPATLDRFRKEIGTDYLNILLIHSQTFSNWPNELVKMMDQLSEAKQKGIVQALGVSCHSLAALKAAVSSD